MYRQQRRDRQEKWQRENKERDRYLYSLIKSQKGRVTLLQYAMESGLTPEEARTHLEKRAADFSALVEVNEQGETVYQFFTGER